MKRYVIIGGGVASIGCIEGIREVDKEGSVLLISEEGVPTYCRPLISYYLEGKTTLEKMAYRPASFYEEMGCKVLYGKAEKVDAQKQTVSVNGESIPYDELCIATGSTPFVPPFTGLETVPVKTGFMRESDALYLESVIDPTSRVLIVGAGLIGLKCAEGIAERVASVTVCDLADRVLSSILDAESAAYMQKELEAHGVVFHLGNSVSRFEGKVAVLTDGTEVPFDVLVTAVGVRANVAIVKEVVKTERGILTDVMQKTSCEHVYAAGDCCQGYDASIGGSRVVAIWCNAFLQGKTAGANMAGVTKIFDKGMPLNAIGFFGLHALTAGAYTGQCVEVKTESTMKRFFIDNGYLVGFMLIGDFLRAGILTDLVRNKTPLAEVEDKFLEEEPTLSILRAEKRKNILGGVV